VWRCPKTDCAVLDLQFKVRAASPARRPASSTRAIASLGECSCESSRVIDARTFLNKEIEVLTVQQEINTQARADIDRSQREFFLRQQLKAIQSELGRG